MYSDKDHKMAELISRAMLGGLDADEERELRQWLDADDANRAMYEGLKREPLGRGAVGVTGGEMMDRVGRAVARRARRRTIVGWAAACVVAGAVVLGVRLSSPAGTQEAVVAQDGAAVLTTSDGRRIALSDGEQDAAWQELAVAPQSAQGGESAPSTIKISVAKGGKFRLELRDGTRVWLNEESSFEYPERFGDEAREVALSGEAFFEVARDSSRTFSVALDGGVSVRVLGTRFNVRSYADMDDITAVLVEGSVEVARGGEVALLVPGQRATLAKSGGAIAVDAPADAAANMEWIYGMFEFDNRPLSEIVDALGAWYGLDVRFDGRLARRFGEVSFHCVKYAESGKVVERLAAITGLDIEVVDGAIVVSERSQSADGGGQDE
jgi:ferric-dicitrate binding protein FerR (iron transport regulator)